MGITEEIVSSVSLANLCQTTVRGGIE